MAVEPAQATYYGLPVLKRPHWKWEIVLYFWIGGIAAGASVIAAIADLFGDEEDRRAAKAGRLIALPLMAVAPALLIKDLGRPERFLNMLRVFKVKSPMSMGTWGLTTFGTFAGLSAFLELLPFHGLRKLAGLLGAPFALFVGGYTGVLISATAIPIWFKNRLLWGPTFLASAFSTGIAAVQAALALAGTPSEKLHQADTLALAAEAGLLGSSLTRLGDAGAPLTKGRWSTLFLPGALGLGVGLPLLLGLFRGGRTLALIRSLCVLVGGLALRACVIYAGKDSADDPQAYFALTGRNGSR
ncbi:MAG TPA: NrfD/PsrC family molybdoenzyme membrane anchor subunit [Chloroflexota bacterium]|nr:NrfD/PsrC family molybdoenzyme membrane anchor subunit [Chloroflexota bacterium]